MKKICLRGILNMVMLNPEIVKQSGEYETEESCLSLLGGPRKTKRYQKIKVQYQTLEFQTRLKTFTGWTAQSIRVEAIQASGVFHGVRRGNTIENDKKEPLMAKYCHQN